MAKIKAAILLLVVTLDHTIAQPTLNGDSNPEHGPKDRFTEGAKIKTLFDKIDLNSDNKLDKNEVHVYFQTQGAPVSAGLWEHQDKNGDGFIDLREFARPDAGDEL